MRALTLTWIKRCEAAIEVIAGVGTLPLLTCATKVGFEPDAQFPSPQPTVIRNLNTFITVLFRGNSVVTDLEPQFKDKDLLIDCATDLINAQVDAIGTTT